MLANEFDRTVEEYFGTKMLAASVPHSGESRSEPQRARNENAAMNGVLGLALAPTRLTESSALVRFRWDFGVRLLSDFAVLCLSTILEPIDQEIQLSARGPNPDHQSSLAEPQQALPSPAVPRNYL